MTERPTRIVPIALLTGALMLAGCGVKGPLEPPVGSENTASPNPLQTTVVPDAPGATVTSTQTQTATSKAFNTPMGNRDETKKNRIMQGKVPVTSKPEKPDRDFFLDKLL